MDQIVCRKCGIPYGKRSIVLHASNCSGGVEGFTPVHHKGRYFYRCHECGVTVQKSRAIQHQSHCKKVQDSTKFTGELTHTAASSQNSKDSSGVPIISEPINSQISIKDCQNHANTTFFYQKPPSKPCVYPSSRNRAIYFHEDDLIFEEDEPLPPPPIAESVLEAEKVQSSIATLTQTTPISNNRKLKDFRQSINANNPSLPKVIEILGLSCFLKLVGRFTRDERWQLSHGLIKKADYWEFLGKAQPWIVNNKTFAGMVEDKLKYFIHDEHNFIVTNFQFLYQRVKDLIQNYQISPPKVQKVFTRPTFTKKFKRRTKRKDPQTMKLRIQLKQFCYRRRKANKSTKAITGIRKMTQLKYQAIKHQAQSRDELFYMKQVFRKKPSLNHRAEVTRKRRRLMINFCMSEIAHRLTAAVILGQFRVWSNSIESIDPHKRYMHMDNIPSIPAFQLWYPLTMDYLREWKWYYPYIYSQCNGFFESPLPQLTEDQLFSKVCTWYRSKGLLIDHSLYELEGFDSIRALVDDKYRIEQEKLRMNKKVMTFAINQAVIFPEDREEESDHQLSADEGVQFAADVPARGDPERWKIVHQTEHRTGFNNCAGCQMPLTFPAPACQSCSTAYHYACRKELYDRCLCFVYLDYSPEQVRKIFNQSIAEAKQHAKHVELPVKPPPKANCMELRFQQENLGLNMESATHAGLWCLPSSIKYDKSAGIPYLGDKTIAILEKFGKTSVFPGIIEEVVGKGRGVIASRDVKKGQIVAVYPGRIITQAEVIDLYKNCKYIFNFQDGPTPFTSWAIVPEGVAHLGMFINHGTPNIAPSRCWSSKGPLLVFLSIRKISVGEEFLYDYGPEYPGRQSFI